MDTLLLLAILAAALFYLYQIGELANYVKAICSNYGLIR